MKVKKLCKVLNEDCFVNCYFDDGNYIGRMLPPDIKKKYGEMKVSCIWNGKLEDTVAPNWGSIVNISIR